MTVTPPPISSTLNERTDVLSLDPGELYWGVLRPLGPKADIDTLRFAFERYLPLPVDDVECRFVCVPTDQRAGSTSVWIACGIARESLRERLDANDRPIESVRPASLPGFLGVDESYGDRFEFRSGEFTSPKVRRHRRRLSTAAVLAIITLSGFVSAGYVLSAKQLAHRAATITQQTESDLRGALTALDLFDSSPGSDVRASLILASQLRKAERSRTPVSGTDPANRSAAPAYITLLASWPGDVRAAVDSLQVGDAGMTMTGTLADAGDWERLRAALTEQLEGWSEQGASINRSNDRYRFSIRFERSTESEAP
ncbi:MAG: hypothetical protein RLN60_05780 [Phycisphaerales bacterium]